MLSIIIVNYRSAQLIADCLQTFYRYNNQLSVEVIVVDNASGDNSKTVITTLFPQVKWIDAGYNAGFARANNMGLKIALGDTALLLNPDTISVDNSIQLCYEQLQNSNYIAVGIQLLNREGIPQISGAHFIKGGLNHLLPIPYWGDFIRWLGYRLNTKVPGIEQAGSIEEMDWISGAFLMVKKNALTKAGLLDEDFFLYAEEVEWCSRLRKWGKLCLYGDLKIIHLEGASIDVHSGTKEQGYYNLYDKKGLQLMVSNHVRVRKQYGAGWFLILLLNYTFGVLVFWIAGTLHQVWRLKNPFQQWKRVGAFAKNVWRLWQLAPTIIRSKPHFYKMF